MGRRQDLRFLRISACFSQPTLSKVTIVPKASNRGAREDLEETRIGVSRELQLFGERVEQYQILELIGKGGFGEVYRAHDLLLDREVAVKVLPPEFSEDPVRRERLIAEARAASQLNHPNICTIHQLIVVKDRILIVMELVRGKTLRQIRRQHPLPQEQVVRIARQLASGLNAAHRAGIIHRDIKSANIILNSQGETKILDFGLAKHHGSSEGVQTSAATMTSTQEGTVVGTVPYMSPEQLRSEPLDQRSDLFSLGIVLYELIMGSLPFQGDTLSDVAHAVLNLPPPQLPTPDPGAETLHEVVTRLLAKEPEERYQSADEVLATLRTGHTGQSVAPAEDSATLAFPAPRRPTAPKLPRLTGRLVGREAEIAQLTDWLQDSQTRLVTLVGPGGVGKSSLALALAHQEAERFGHGAYFVPLAHAAGSLVAPAIAEAVGVSFHGPEEPMAQLIEHLAECESLIVLDNFEHLVNAAELVSEFLQECPRCFWLVTSRERLNLRAEKVFEVRGLTYPKGGRGDPEKRYSAVDLFAERARQGDSEFRLAEELPQVHEICRLTYGLPLGIELAAAWIRLMNCTEIMEEIKKNLEFLTSTSRDLPDRHRSLRAVFEYSWNLLDAREQKVFQRLSIFQGGFDREAAQAVCKASVNDLLSLLDKSLLRKEAGGRLAVHELLRQFGEEKLRGADDDYHRIRNCHCDHYADYLREQGQDLRGPKVKSAIEAIRREWKNIRHGLQWAIKTQRLPALKQSLEEALLFFEIRSRFREAHDLFQQLAESLQPERAKAHSRLRAQALAATALFSVYLGRYEEAVKTGKKALALLDPDGPDDTIATGYSYYSIGQAEQAMGNYDAALEHMNAGLEALEALSDAYWLNHARIATAQLHAWRGEGDQARRLYLRGVRGCEQIGDVWGMKAGLLMLGSLDLERGDLESAKSMFEDGLEFVRDLEDRRGIASCLAQLGRVAFESEQYEEARRLYRESLGLAVELRDKHRHRRYLIWLSKLEDRAGETARSERVLSEALRLSRQSSAVPEMLEILLEFARRRYRAGHQKQAIALLGLIMHHSGIRQDTLAEARKWLSKLRQCGDSEWIEDQLALGRQRELTSAVDEFLEARNPTERGDGRGVAK